MSGSLSKLLQTSERNLLDDIAQRADRCRNWLALFGSTFGLMATINRQLRVTAWPDD